MSSYVATFALVALLIRLLASVFFVIVIIKQVKLRFGKFDDQLNHFRELLIVVTAIPLLYNFLTIYNNILRVTHGQQNELLNTYTFVFGAVASLVTAIGFWLFYKSPRK